MMKKLLLTSLFCVMTSAANAACFLPSPSVCGPATKYQVTIDAVELCKSSACTSPVTVASTSSAFNIASAAAGAAVGAYADLDTVPAGVYTHVRSTISKTIVYSAAAISGCGAQTNDPHTFTTSEASSAALAAIDMEWTSGNAAFYHKYALATPLAISKAGSLPQIQVDFSTKDAFLCASGTTPMPGPPLVTVTVLPN